MENEDLKGVETSEGDKKAGGGLRAFLDLG